MASAPRAPLPVVAAATAVVLVGAVLVGVWAGSRGGRPTPKPGVDDPAEAVEPTDAAAPAADTFLPAADSFARDPAAARGEAVFAERCASCHTIGGGDREGPDLALAAMRRDPAWVSAMILAPDSMFRADSVARWILDVHDVPEDATRDHPDLEALADFFANVAAVPRRMRAPSPD